MEDSHDMEDHEKCGNLNVLDVFEVEHEEIQTLDVVEEELEFPLAVKVMQLWKKSMIPLHWNQSMTKVSHF